MAFFNYPGNKTKSLSKIRALIPEIDWSTTRYIEPFVGSGSLAFGLGFVPKEIILNDNDPRISKFFKCLQEISLPLVQKQLLGLQSNDCKDLFTNLCKTLDSTTNPNEYVARYIYLRAHSYFSDLRKSGGTYRDIGTNLCKIFTERYENLKEYTITCDDYSNILEQCVQGDVVVLDPPYFKTYAVYSTRNFDHHKFLKVIEDLNGNGVRVILFNDLDISEYLPITFTQTIMKISHNMKTTECLYMNF